MSRFLWFTILLGEEGLTFKTEL